MSSVGNWVGDWIGSRARYSGGKTAVVDIDTGKKFSYDELNEKSERMAQWLLNKGLKKGSVICVISPNCVEQVELMGACGKTGMILNPISFRLQKNEIKKIFDISKPDICFYDDEYADLVPSSFQEKYSINDKKIMTSIYLTRIKEEVNTEINIEDPFFYIHTGGTTSTPKVCIIPHRQMIFNSMELFSAYSHISEETRYLIFFPFFHIGGWNILIPIFHIGGTVYISREFNSKATINAIENYKINLMGAVEIMLRMISSEPCFEKANLSSVEAIITAAAPCKKDACIPFWEKGILTFHAYGLTEGGPSNFLSVPKKFEMIESVRLHDTAGKITFHSDFKILEIDSCKEVEQGKIGRLFVRSLHNFSGYLGDKKETDKILGEDGWINTKDLAKINEEGNVFICGRSDFMFISGGENVSPEEIEQAALKNDQVFQALCVGIPDKEWGEVPALAVVFYPGQSEPNLIEVLNTCKKHIAGFKVPKKIITMDQLPVTAIGKPDRAGLKKFFYDEVLGK